MLTQRSPLSFQGRHGRRRLSRPPRPRCGFSLPELLTVMAVMGVVGLMVAPKIEVMRYKMDGAARGAVTALVSAQRLAVQRQHDVVVAFDTTDLRLLIHQDADNDGVRDSSEQVRVVTLDQEVRFGLGGAPLRPNPSATITFDEALDGLPAFRFRRNGSASQEGGFYLTSARADGSEGHAVDTRAVQVARATGRVSWHHFRDGSWTSGF